MAWLLQSLFWKKLEHWDQSLFVKVNNQWINPVFDSVMPFMRTSQHWMPLYLFLLVFALLNFKRQGLFWCLFFLVTVALTDMTGKYIFKDNIERLRPCGDPAFFSQVRLLVPYCSGGHSFISNHAANHFGLAIYFFLTMRPLLKSWAAIGFVWAALIAYAQVYVGVHYPLDILAGMIIGLIFGTLTGRLFNKRFGFAIFGNQPTMSS